MNLNTVKLFVKNRLLSLVRNKQYSVPVLLLCVPLIIVLYHPLKYVTTGNVELGKPCKLHKLDPWDVTLKHYLRAPGEIHCSSKSSLLYIDSSGYLQFNTSAISQYSLTSLKCAYQLINRNGGDKIKHIKYEDAVSFRPPMFVPGRQFRVACKDQNSKLVYDFIHINVAWNDSQIREDAIKFESDEQLSVIVFGFDSASRSHALRKLPLSYKYLTETLGSYDFEGYMKVGLNSFPNLIPLLTGENSNSFPMENVFHSYLDGLPFIWKDMAKKGYATHHNEDRPDIATMNFLKGGFQTPPVDYYNRPYALAMSDIEPVILEPLGKSTWHCYGNKNHFDLQIDYLKRFITKYTKRLKFSFLWNNQIGHEDFLSLGRGDKPMLEFLKWMKMNGHLEKAVLITVSDHGFRMGGASTTNIGRLENNMPFMTIYIPEVLKSKYKWMHDNLLHNTQQLITTYDAYATIKDVLNQNFVNSVSPPVSAKQTRRSLLNKIPTTRTCQDAGVPPQHCSCYDDKPVPLTNPLLKSFALYTVDQLNYMLLKYSDLCEKLTFLNVSEAKVMSVNEGDKDRPLHPDTGMIDWLLNKEAPGSGRYVVMLYTKPADALFEVWLDFEIYADRVEHEITMVADPMRINKYGDQSHCITDADLKQYCYCYKQL